MTFTHFKSPNSVWAEVCVRFMWISGALSLHAASFEFPSAQEGHSSGRLAAAHKCMELAIKLTLCQLFSHMFDGPLAAHLLPQGYKRRKAGADAQKMMTDALDATRNARGNATRSGSDSALFWNLVNYTGSTLLHFVLKILYLIWCFWSKITSLVCKSLIMLHYQQMLDSAFLICLFSFS